MPKEHTPKVYIGEKAADLTIREVSSPVADLADDKVNRLTLSLEESISRSIQWAAFEPNGEPR